MPGSDDGIARRGVLGGGAAALLSAALPSRAGATMQSGLPSVRPVFATDIRRPGLLHAVMARPPLPGWRLAACEAAATLAMTRVVAVIPLPPCEGNGPVRLGGVAVLARDTWSALRGHDALRPVWTAGAQSGRERAAGVFVPETAEPLMEPPSATVQAGEHHCAVWTCLREPPVLRRALAAQLGLPADAVTLHPTAPACGPARYADPAYAVEAALLSRATAGAPVSLTWTPADDMPFRRRTAWS